MIYLNCNQTPSSGKLVSNVNCVIFENIKPGYRSDEDITIEYILGPDTEVSSRNWIGLYAKDATQLDQYITFEWTIVSPKNESLKCQTITFCSKYHINKIEAHKEYFFIFVNKHMKVIGSSSVFHFFFYHTLEIEDLKVPEKVTPYDCSTPESLKSCSDDNMKMILTDVVNKGTVQEFHYHAKNKQDVTLSSTQFSENNCVHLSNFKADITLTSPDFPTSVNPCVSNNNIHCCALCKRPSNFAEIEQTLNTKIKMHAEHAHTLQKRIEELEKMFEMSQVAQKQLKLIAYHAKREKMSYQKFVNEMLSVLTNKGAVRILDGHGTELLLKRVDSTPTESQDSAISCRKSHREDILKAVISSQENTIRDLTEKLVSYSSTKEKDNLIKAGEGNMIELNYRDTCEKENEKSVDSNIPPISLDSPGLNLRINARKQQDGDTIESLNQCQENVSVDYTLNKTFSIDNFEGETVSVIIPSNDSPQLKNRPGKFEGSRKCLTYLSTNGQGDCFDKSSVCEENIHELKQNVMKELRNVILKRQDTTDKLKHGNSDVMSSDSFNLSINETVQSTRVEESNALIIKGDHLQYAIIRIQQSPEKHQHF